MEIEHNAMIFLRFEGDQNRRALGHRRQLHA